MIGSLPFCESQATIYGSFKQSNKLFISSLMPSIVHQWCNLPKLVCMTVRLPKRKEAYNKKTCSVTDFDRSVLKYSQASHLAACLSDSLFYQALLSTLVTALCGGVTWWEGIDTTEPSPTHTEWERGEKNMSTANLQVCCTLIPFILIRFFTDVSK